MIIADECLDNFFSKSLHNAGFTVNIISLTQLALPDKKIIELSLKEKAIIITEDRDFGKFIFDDNNYCFGIIYLRKYDLNDRPQILQILFNLLKDIKVLENHLVVIRNLKIRKRKFTK